MMRTRTQCFSTPFTVMGEILAVKLTTPDAVKALVVSLKSGAWPGLEPLVSEVPNCTQLFPTRASQLSTGGLSESGTCSVRVTFSLILALGFEKASSSDSQKVSLNLGFSPKGKKSLLRSIGNWLKKAVSSGKSERSTCTCMETEVTFGSWAAFTMPS